MDTTILVAKVLGIYLVVSGLFLMIRGKSLAHLMKDFVGHPAVMYLSGVILIFLSSIYLLQFNIWDGGWKMLITILAWLTLLKGVLYIFAPHIVSEAALKKMGKFTTLYGVLAVVAGLCLFFLIA